MKGGMPYGFCFWDEESIGKYLESLKLFYQSAHLPKRLMFLMGSKFPIELDIGLLSLKTHLHLKIDFYWKLLF